MYYTCYAKNFGYDALRNESIPAEVNTRYVIKKELGKGAYGTVYLAVDRISGEQFLWNGKIIM